MGGEGSWAGCGRIRDDGWCFTVDLRLAILGFLALLQLVTLIKDTFR